MILLLSLISCLFQAAQVGACSAQVATNQYCQGGSIPFEEKTLQQCEDLAKAKKAQYFYFRQDGKCRVMDPDGHNAFCGTIDKGANADGFTIYKNTCAPSSIPKYTPPYLQLYQNPGSDIQRGRCSNGWQGAHDVKTLKACYDVCGMGKYMSFCAGCIDARIGDQPCWCYRKADKCSLDTAKPDFITYYTRMPDEIPEFDPYDDRLCDAWGECKCREQTRTCPDNVKAPKTQKCKEGPFCVPQPPVQLGGRDWKDCLSFRVEDKLKCKCKDQELLQKTDTKEACGVAMAAKCPDNKRRFVYRASTKDCYCIPWECEADTSGGNCNVGDYRQYEIRGCTSWPKPKCSSFKCEFGAKMIDPNIECDTGTCTFESCCEPPTFAKGVKGKNECNVPGMYQSTCEQDCKDAATHFKDKYKMKFNTHVQQKGCLQSGGGEYFFNSHASGGTYRDSTPICMSPYATSACAEGPKKTLPTASQAHGWTRYKAYPDGHHCLPENWCSSPGSYNSCPNSSPEGQNDWNVFQKNLQKSTLQACQTAVDADPDCGTWFFYKSGNCFCVKKGHVCSRTTGWNVGDYAIYTKSVDLTSVAESVTFVQVPPAILIPLAALGCFISIQAIWNRMMNQKYTEIGEPEV